MEMYETDMEIEIVTKMMIEMDKALINVSVSVSLGVGLHNKSSGVP